MEKIKGYLEWLSLIQFNTTDLIEIIILSFLVYQIILWIKNTRAWMIAKGIVVVLIFVLLAIIFHLNTILWLFSNSVTFIVIALVIVFQPEFRMALEEIGRKNFFYSMLPFEDNKKEEERISKNTVNAIAKACGDMAKVKTGALIVIERNVQLSEYERTGIAIDSLITSQLLINIFEHNTPLHDGAVLIRNNRIVAATCYLPLTQRLNVAKELGTRHRAAIGISEVGDSYTVVVSEETGTISVAYEGYLHRNMSVDQLKKFLSRDSHEKVVEKTKSKFKIWKGRSSDGKKDKE